MQRTLLLVLSGYTGTVRRMWRTISKENWRKPMVCGTSLQARIFPDSCLICPNGSSDSKSRAVTILLSCISRDEKGLILMHCLYLWNAKLTETQIFRELFWIEELSNRIKELSNWIKDLLNLIKALLNSIRELLNATKELFNLIRELFYSIRELFNSIRELYISV